MNNATPKVDGYIRKNKQWQAELTALRRIALESGLTEDIKWRTPCYTDQGQNIVLIGCGKNNCAMSFLKGVLLKDTRGILVAPGANTQSARMAKFTSVEEITRLRPVLKELLEQAIAAERAGLKVEFKKEFEIPAELQARFDENVELETAFTSLTPGRQRAYILYISAAKQSKTRASRIEKHIPRILEGKGLDD